MDGESSGSKQFDGAERHETKGAPIRLRGDELDLYMEFHRELFQDIRRTVNTSIETVADACSFAWVQFLRQQPDRDTNWKGWLVTTARREAWRLHAIAWRERESFDPDREPRVGGDPHDRFELRLRLESALEELKRLPRSQQQVVLVRSQVVKRDDVASILGIGRDQVDRLLRAAAVQLAEVNEDRHERDRPVALPRAARLRELEDDPPEWLSKVIGRCPQRSKSSAGVILAWRRAALAIDDYRRLTGYDNPYEAIGFAPQPSDERRTYVRAERAILRVAEERGRRHGIER